MTNPIDNPKVFAAVVDAVVDGIIVINAKGEILSANQAVESMFGYPKKALIGKNVSILMHAEHSTRHDGYLEKYLYTGIKKIIGIGREVEGKRKDNTYFPFRLAVSEVILESEHIFAGIIHDISEIKQAQSNLVRLNAHLEEKVEHRTVKLQDTVNRLLESNKRLNIEITKRQQIEAQLTIALEKEKELNELKSSFVILASHEFKTPLGTILSSASLLEKYTSKETQVNREKHINRIKHAVKHLNHILEDFLSLGKIEEGKVDINNTLVSVTKMAEEVVDIISVNLKARQNISTNLKVINEHQLFEENLTKNVLINLLSNAIKYSPENAEIVFNITELDHEIIFEIIDAGIGIPIRDQARLFERFHRASNVGNAPGTGIGLHICKGYASLMNGSVSFTTTENEGSTFLLKLPKNK